MARRGARHARGAGRGVEAYARHALDPLLDPQKRLAGLLKQMEEEHVAL
ncbi:hypothetical protein [Ottowia beijingensis]|nr:hypothetical protein [Ottowia beijingensis]